MDTSTSAGDGAGAVPGRRRFWIWPFKTSPRLAERAFRLATFGRPLVAGWWWPITALVVGLVPLDLAYLLGLSFHHFVAALFLLPILTACACDDRQGKFLGVVFLSGLAHCALAIFLSAHDPVGASQVFPESDVYWDKTHHWLLTGENPDYNPTYWVPLHLMQLAGLLASGYVSFGLVPLFNELRQLDVMNNYVGRLAGMSHDPGLAVAAGWHPWSFLRVVGYSLLLFEVVSCSLERFTGRTLSTRRRRLVRWGVGLAFCLGDGVVKYLSSDWIRQVLSDNLMQS